jgi:hypothetical protein
LFLVSTVNLLSVRPRDIIFIEITYTMILRLKSTFFLKIRLISNYTHAPKSYSKMNNLVKLHILPWIVK